MHPSTFPPRIPAVSRFSGTHFAAHSRHASQHIPATHPSSFPFSGTHFDRLSVAHFAAHSCHASQHIPATHPSSFPLFWHALRQAHCNTFCSDSSLFSGTHFDRLNVTLFAQTHPVFLARTSTGSM